MCFLHLGKTTPLHLIIWKNYFFFLMGLHSFTKTDFLALSVLHFAGLDLLTLVLYECLYYVSGFYILSSN